MKIVLQRVSEAMVTIDGTVTGQIGQGYVLLVAVNDQDTVADIDYLVNKISKLRVFEDNQHKMNVSLLDIGGSILSISQFTLYANTKKGNRPSFTDAGQPDFAKQMYNAFNQALRTAGITVATGEFGADMQVSLTNDGPVTIIFDTQNK